MEPGFNEREVSGAFPPGSHKMQQRNIRMQSIVKTMNTECHPSELTIYPPAVGAIMGEAPNTSINNAKIFALSSTGNKSLTKVTDTTVAAQLPNACMNLKNINEPIECESAQPIEAKI